MLNVNFGGPKQAKIGVAELFSNGLSAARKYAILRAEKLT